MNFNTLIYIVAAIVPVCMMIHVACDIRDSLKPVPIVQSAPSYELLPSTQPEFELEIESLLTMVAPTPIPALTTFPSHLTVFELPIAVMSKPMDLTCSTPVAELVETVVESPDLTKLTIRELKALAKERKLKNYGKMVKAELINALS